MKKIIVALIALFGWIGTAFAESFDIKNYDIKLDVDVYNNITIEEDIDVFFHTSRHGIFRTIPLINNVVRADGKNYKTFAKVSNIQVDNSYTTEREGNNLKIKIGDPYKFVNGKQSYKIKYVYELQAPDDEFYFNIIGTEWDTNIEKVNFKIQMPKPFPQNETGLSIGEYGTKGFDGGAKFWVNSNTNTIEGYTLKALEPNEAITVRVKLPNHYFLKKKNKIKPLLYFLIFLFTLIPLAYWYTYGKDEKAIPVVNFYPPENYNSASVGLIYNEGAEIEQVVSLIIYLADKGYIKIEDKGSYSRFIKLKDYDGKNWECSMLMSSLFKTGEHVATTELEISRTFYRECQAIIKHLEDSKKFLYEKDSINIMTKLPVIISVIALCIIIFLVVSDFNLDMNELFPLIFSLPFFLAGVYIISQAFTKSNSSVNRIILMFAGIPFLLVFIPLFLEMYSITMLRSLDIVISGIVGLIISIICLCNLPKKNKAGLRLLGHILGYKKFLETAEKHKLEELGEKNPQYFFNMLPYAYVLGVSDVWIEKFESIINYQPEWYSGHFDSNSFRSFTHTVRDVSVPSHANGGISSSSSGGGGGHSGGGSGGGGGGSW